MFALSDLSSVSLWLTFGFFLLLAFGVGHWIGSRRGDQGLEAQADRADVEWLRAALADCERRCDVQTHWIADLEAELVAIRTRTTGKTVPPFKVAPLGPHPAAAKRA
jgi:hypothetical protein